MPSDKPVIKAHVDDVIKIEFAALAVKKRMTESQLLRRIILDYMKEEEKFRKV